MGEDPSNVNVNGITLDVNTDTDGGVITETRTAKNADGIIIKKVVTVTDAEAGTETVTLRIYDPELYNSEWYDVTHETETITVTDAAGTTTETVTNSNHDGSTTVVTANGKIISESKSVF